MLESCQFPAKGLNLTAFIKVNNGIKNKDQYMKLPYSNFSFLRKFCEYKKVNIRIPNQAKKRAENKVQFNKRKLPSRAERSIKDHLKLSNRRKLGELLIHLRQETDRILRGRRRSGQQRRSEEQIQLNRVKRSMESQETEQSCVPRTSTATMAVAAADLGKKSQCNTRRII